MEFKINPRHIKYAAEVALAMVYDARNRGELTADEETTAAGHVMRVGNIAAKCRDRRDAWRLWNVIDGMDCPEPLWEMLTQTRPDLCTREPLPAVTADDQRRDDWIESDLYFLRHVAHAHTGCTCLRDVWNETPERHPRKSLFSSLDDYLTHADAWRSRRFAEMKDLATAIGVLISE